MKYEKLLSPLRIGNVILKNRMFSPNSMPHFLQGPEDFPAEGTRAYVTQLAKNGCSLIIIGDWGNYPGQRNGPIDADGTHFCAWDYKNPSVHNYLSMMADEVHMFGSKLLVSVFQIPMPDGYTVSGRNAFGPPNLPPLKPLPKEMMPQVKADFVKLCKMYKALGFDGYSTRLDLELNPVVDGRTDEYGGSPENRMRFYLEAFAEVKKEIPHFLIEVGIAGEQPKGYTGNLKQGYTLEDAISFAKAAEGTVDILELREMDMTKSHPTGYTHEKGEHNTLDYSVAIKAAGCKILTAPLGGYQDPEFMEKALVKGKCDMFGMARAFFADPEYATKLYQGRGEDVTPCIKCNRCHGTIKTPHDPWLSVCSVNPTHGTEAYIHRIEQKPGASKNVAVIGGGASGMRVAMCLTDRGHKVNVRAGLRLWPACSFPYNTGDGSRIQLPLWRGLRMVQAYLCR